MSVPVKVDGNMINQLSNGGYGTRDIAPGRHQLSAEVWGTPGTSRHDFQAAPGRSYYFLLKFNEEKARIQVVGGALFGLGIVPGLIGTSIAMAATEDGTGPFQFVPMTAAELHKAVAE